MKVLKRIAQRVWKMVRTCKKCRSRLEVSERDIRYSDVSHCDDQYWFRCPVCKEQNIIEGGQGIPDNVIDRINARNPG